MSVGSDDGSWVVDSCVDVDSKTDSFCNRLRFAKTSLLNGLGDN